MFNAVFAAVLSANMLTILAVAAFYAIAKRDKAGSAEYPQWALWSSAAVLCTMSLSVYLATH